jgi:hypothetical protein
VPSRARLWFLNRAFRVGYGLAQICARIRKLWRFGTPGPSNQARALILLLRNSSSCSAR